MTTLEEQLFGMSFLEKASADFAGRNLRCDGKDRCQGFVRVKKSVDEVKIARATASGAGCDVAGQLRFGTGRECSSLFVADMNPVDIFVVMYSINDAVQRVPNHAIDALN